MVESSKTFGVVNNYRKADFWDLRNLRPPTGNCDEYQFEICRLTSKKFSDFKRLIESQQVTFLKSVTYKMEKSFIETLRTWGENVYCLSSF